MTYLLILVALLAEARSESCNKYSTANVLVLCPFGKFASRHGRKMLLTRLCFSLFENISETGLSVYSKACYKLYLMHFLFSSEFVWYIISLIFLPDSEVRIGATAASAALVALDTIKERRILPESFNLNVKFADSKCSSVSTLKAILETWDGEGA